MSVSSLSRSSFVRATTSRIHLPINTTLTRPSSSPGRNSGVPLSNSEIEHIAERVPSPSSSGSSSSTGSLTPSQSRADFLVSTRQQAVTSAPSWPYKIDLRTRTEQLEDAIAIEVKLNESVKRRRDRNREELTQRSESIKSINLLNERQKQNQKKFVYSSLFQLPENKTAEKSLAVIYARHSSCPITPAELLGKDREPDSMELTYTQFLRKKISKQSQKIQTSDAKIKDLERQLAIESYLRK